MLKPIKTGDQYDESLARIYDLMQKDAIVDGSPESDELELLIILVKEYENEHYPMPSPNSL
jgi:HTH-type transcriptional regulator / antitoxin HigA